MNISEIRDELSKNASEQRRLIALLEQEIGSNMNHQNRSKVCKQVLFNEKEPVPKSLRHLLDLPKKDMTRAEVTRYFYDYIKEHDLINKKKRIINLDDDMKQVFGDVELTFYNIQRYLNLLYD